MHSDLTVQVISLAAIYISHERPDFRKLVYEPSMDNL